MTPGCFLHLGVSKTGSEFSMLNTQANSQASKNYCLRIIISWDCHAGFDLRSNLLRNGFHGLFTAGTLTKHIATSRSS